ncbi:threonine dehydratase [Pycnococcus provasolii]
MYTYSKSNHGLTPHNRHNGHVLRGTSLKGLKRNQNSHHDLGVVRCRVSAPDKSSASSSASAASPPHDDDENNNNNNNAHPGSHLIVEAKPDDIPLELGQLGPIGHRNANSKPAGNFDASNSKPSSEEYLRMVLTSNVYDVAHESALDKLHRLSERYPHADILMKREDLQSVFSFKLRGAYNKMASLTAEELARGVICSSAGNHAQGVALSAKRLGTDALIAMPTNTPGIKVESVRRLGGNVHLVGETYDACQAWAKKTAEEQGRVYVHPFDDPHVIAGQGTVGLEILTQLGRANGNTKSADTTQDVIFVPVGGGGLIAGIATYVKALRPDVLVVGVEPSGANAMMQSLARSDDKRVVLSTVDGFCDGVAVRTPGDETLRVARHTVDGIVTVPTNRVCAAIRDAFDDTRSILEPAGAVALAGCKDWLASRAEEAEEKGIRYRCVCISSGANVNFSRLRVVSDLADLGDRAERLFVTRIDETPGSFLSFVRDATDNGEGSVDFSEFKYRYHPGSSANIFYSVKCRTDDREAMLERIARNDGRVTHDLSGSDVAATHLRHIVGGKERIPFERFYQFQFPERPGTLLQFLETVAPAYNITLFHYRSSGTFEANILIGLQVSPGAQESELESLCQNLMDEHGFKMRNLMDDATEAAGLELLLGAT